MFEQLLSNPAMQPLANISVTDEGTGVLALVGIAVLMVGSLVLGVKLPRMALPLSPFLSFAVTFCVVTMAGESGDEYVTGIGAALGLLNLLLTLMAILASKVGQGQTVAHDIARAVLNVFAILIAAGVLAMIFGPIGLLLGIGVFAAFIRYLLISRNTFCAHVFAALVAATRQSLPLPAVLGAEANALTGKWRRIMLRISQLLSEGYPLGEALRRGFPQCPGFALGQIAAAERTHQLPQAIAFIEGELQRKSEGFRRLQPVSPIYPLLLIFFGCSILGAMTRFVIPSFQMIFMDMGNEMPRVTAWVIDTLASFSGFGWMFLAAPFVLIGIWLYVSFRRRDPHRPKQFSYVGDFFKWHLPILHWFEKNFAMLQTVTVLRTSLSAGSTVNQAIGDATELDMNLVYRDKLRKWLILVESGLGASQAARAAGVSKSLQWAFDQEVNPGQTLSVLEMLENSYRCAYSYKANLARLIFWPCVTIMLAGFVGVIVLAMFLPLIKLIQIVSVDIIP